MDNYYCCIVFGRLIWSGVVFAICISRVRFVLLICLVVIKISIVIHDDAVLVRFQQRLLLLLAYLFISIPFVWPSVLILRRSRLWLAKETPRQQLR